MISNLFDINIEKNIKISITPNEIYNQLLLYIFFSCNKNLILVTPNLNDANKLYSQLSKSVKNIYIFPDDDYLTKKAIATSPELMFMRMKFLNKIQTDEKFIMICHTSSLLKKLPSKLQMQNKNLELKVNTSCDRQLLIEKLMQIGYKKESIVTNTGEFSVRGFVIDVFPIFEEHPIRIEFFDNDIEEIKYFDENTQLSLSNIDHFIIKPIIDEYKNSNSNILDYIDNYITIYQDYLQIYNVEKNLITQMKYYQEDDFLFKLSDIKPTFSIYIDTLNNNGNYNYMFHAESIMNYNNDKSKFLNDIFNNNGYLCTTDKEFVNSLSYNGKILNIDITSGFIYNSQYYYSKNDLLVNHSNFKYNTGFKLGKKIDSLDKLEIGDYVVHKTNGVGVYMGLSTISKNGKSKDYILIKYKGDDKLYLPVEDFDKLYKYSSKEGTKPIIHKLNSIEWQKTKLKIKNKIKDISNELIKIYQKRNVTLIEPFKKDTPEQTLFESEFIFDETPDQLKCTLEIKHDLESSKPMDRLLCGDVGYGKTEVIFRAIFKAIMNGKQVMYLCPTTLLSYQQYTSALSRFKNFAVNIALLNRYTSKKDEKEILDKLETGKIDVIFGTHKLLGNQIKYRELGLLVIDEEQRFGVMHKEKIKQIKSNVHVLSVSATPIPRSLQMSLIGIRDLSLIETPPANKLPVQTYVIGYDPYIIREVILKEKARYGQSFILYNKVENMENIVQTFAKLIPEVTFCFAHGKMKKEDMQDVIYRFNQGAFDVLVSTTIIENGIDVPNANTMIVIDADHFGLSQLYQIRGRVGRSDKQAYAYLMYDKSRLLTETAIKRLDSIKEFTELGSGYKIAMRDLSIRGAGDLLGSEQAGFIDSVGVDLYLELVNEELNGKVDNNNEILTKIDDVQNHIDKTYSDEDNIIIDLHKKISKISNEEEYKMLYNEIQDRFGIVDETLDIYMHEILVQNLVNEIGIIVNVNDNGKFSMKLDENIYNSLNIEQLFITATKICTKFNFLYKGNSIFISIIKNNLDNHYLYYVYELLIYISKNRK
mgnify:CR=1 FL=1